MIGDRLRGRGPRSRTVLVAVVLAGLVACASPPPPRAPASEQSLRDIGSRNDVAAAKARVEQRGRTRTEADIRAAERRDAARDSSEPR